MRPPVTPRAPTIVDPSIRWDCWEQDMTYSPGTRRRALFRLVLLVTLMFSLAGWTGPWVSAQEADDTPAAETGSDEPIATEIPPAPADTPVAAPTEAVVETPAPTESAADVGGAQPPQIAIGETPLRRAEREPGSRRRPDRDRDPIARRDRHGHTIRYGRRDTHPDRAVSDQQPGRSQRPAQYRRIAGSGVRRQPARGDRRLDARRDGRLAHRASAFVLAPPSLRSLHLQRRRGEAFAPRRRV